MISSALKKFGTVFAMLDVRRKSEGVAPGLPDGYVVTW